MWGVCCWCVFSVLYSVLYFSGCYMAVFTVPAVLLILAFTLVIVYKCKVKGMHHTHNMHKHTHPYTHNCDSICLCVSRTWSQFEQKHNIDGWSRGNDGRDYCKKTWLKQISLVAPRGNNVHYTPKYKSVAHNEEQYAYFAIPRDIKVKICKDHCGERQWNHYIN